MTSPGDGRTLLYVEDDDALRARLGAALRRRGFDVRLAASGAEAAAALAEDTPELALVDLRLPDTDGLTLVRQLRAADPTTLVVVFTGYGSIPTALEAMQAGATWVLTKPADADDVLAAFARGDPSLAAAPAESPERRPPSLARVEWEHIQRVLADCDGNVSHAAAALGIHRRSLQRKLAKRPVLR